MAEKIAGLRASRQEHAALLRCRRAPGPVSAPPTPMRKMCDTQRGGFFIGYNVRVAVDANMTSSSPKGGAQSDCDRGQLGAVAQAARS
ncbi:hypothetical protein [Prosthecobacter sp.]|uniref:hypothetical protein n=1 Tax=Prosthecobacter sp. TaxID=1965333 RepID=UPI003784FC7C